MLRAIILIVAFVAVKGDECAQRSYGNVGSVCVCNATYCDTIEVPPLKEKNKFLWYKSVKDGKMMEYSFNNFSTENKSNNKSENYCRVFLTLNSNKKYQEICGFGGAMTDAAALNINSLSNNTGHKLLSSYYGVNGIGYTFSRIPIAGTDFSTRGYSYDDEPGDITLSKFSLVKEDHSKIQHLQHIKSIMPNSTDLRILAASWSAPAWMKFPNNIKYGVLKWKYCQIYADYILKFFNAYKEENINIWAMTPGNEPLDGFIPGFPFNSMGWTPFTEAKWTVDCLAPTLSKAGYKDLIYIAMDDQRFELPFYPALMFLNKKAEKLFSGIAIHWYTDKLFPASLLTLTHKIYPHKFLLMTEACTGTFVTNFGERHVELGSWHRGEQYILDIIESLSHWVCGWIDWNIALDEKGGPNWVGNNVDSPIIVNSEKDEFYKQPMFYALSHFSKFVPRGSNVIFSTQENPLCQKIQSIAFLTPEQKIVVVIANTNNYPVPLIIKDKTTNKTIDINLPPKSFHTISYLA